MGPIPEEIVEVGLNTIYSVLGLIALIVLVMIDEYGDEYIPLTYLR